MVAWSDEMVTLAREEWTKGASATTIARDICSSFRVPLTRNAVIGKLHRLGLTRNDAPKRDRRPRAKRQPQTRSRFGFQRPYALPPPSDKAAPPPPVEAQTVEQADFPNRKTLFELKHGDCRFIPGDPRGGEYFFCGEPVRGESSWCRYHWQLVHEH